MPEHVLVVGTGREFPGRVRAASPGTVTTVMCRVEYVHKVRDAHENARVIALRERADDEEWIALAAAVHAHQPFTRIATVGERDQDRCAAIGAALGLPTHSPETVALVHDKNLMRDRLVAAGLDSTAHTIATGENDVRSFLRAHGGPCVVKPVSGAGSVGVALARTEADVPAAWRRASGDHTGITGAGVIVEQYHEGDQFSVEGLSEAGEHVIVSITRKFSDPATFVELGHVVPAGLSDAQRAAAEAYVTRVLDALGVEFGATHTEIVLGDHGPRLIETHVRVGGDEIPGLTLDVTGVDLSDCVVRQTLGDKVLPGVRALLAAPRERVASAIWFAALPGTGVLEEVSGTAEARATAGVTDVQVTARPGTALGGLASSDSRVAAVRALAATPREAVAAAQQGVGHLGFHVRSRAHISGTV
ncbi:ATP-grasp domain-containing protein [Streptantibioticus silvisoli]|uniref:ATP-grasp domain-containing protein n=1 Tax=Streptantibioticus silvisoli TaxID=2705255 RepID=A0ABT6W702_9ACTN|nr:ATP-grasp domain-containing protein [Streptantibioticus silvisoli]MDI5966525.1 ATP-grasp domain-containing protein [Streptantibioticus silvisoli]